MGKMILNLAMSIDGYIARSDGGFDWIKGDGDLSSDTKEKFDFQSFLDTIEVVVMGAKAYEDCPEEGIDILKDKTIYVVTSRQLEHDSNVILIRDNYVDELITLKADKNIWLYGGGVVLQPLIERDLIDDYIIGIIPVILGSGRPLFFGQDQGLPLHLKRSTAQEGIVILEYERIKENMN